MQDGLIVKGVGGLYTVDTKAGIIKAKPRGIFRKKEIAKSPVVGDLVSVSILEEDENTGVIEKIHERKTLLIRPKVANVTQALIVFAYKEPDLHLDLLDRFIILCEWSGIDCIIAFNKMDLLSEKKIEETENIKNIYEKAGFRVVELSAWKNMGTDKVKSTLYGEVTVFAGPSGAGKSSIFNAISGKELMEIGELSSKIRRGKHTTRHSQLIKFADDSYIVDSPGFSSLDLTGIAGDELKNLFREFKEQSIECRFVDCNHIDEPDCMVKQGVSSGLISDIRYKRYLSFYEQLRGGK